jgi:hypothetical protein
VNAIATFLITSALLGAATSTQELPRSAAPPRTAGTPLATPAPRTPQPPIAERQPAEERERTPAPPPPPAAPTATQAPRAGREVPPPPPAAPLPVGDRRGIPVRNVKVDVTITDQTGTGAAMKKIVSLVVADGRSSSVRSMTQVATQRRETETSVPVNDYRNVPLNIDTYVSITTEQRVLLELKFNYGSVRSGGTAQPGRDGASVSADAMYGEITENLWTLLNAGEPVVVSRSADAASDRTVTVEVKAEILK